MGEQHANGWRVSRRRLVADATVGVIANPDVGPIELGRTDSGVCFAKLFCDAAGRRRVQVQVLEPRRLLRPGVEALDLDEHRIGSLKGGSVEPGVHASDGSMVRANCRRDGVSGRLRCAG